MTDAVSKNVKVGEGVAEKLESKHIPFRIFCKAHTCEALDRSNREVLKNVEKKLN